MEKQLKITHDGSATFFVPSLNEHYHSVHGALNESIHVFINNGYYATKNEPVAVFELGLGTGLNALLTAIEAKNTGRVTRYYALEKYLVETILTEQLNYTHVVKDTAAQDTFERIHQSPWGKQVGINPWFEIIKTEGDIQDIMLDMEADVVYFDAFAPDKQPEMWTHTVFEKMHAIMKPGGVLTTYCAKGDVRRSLQDVGFQVERLPGPPGKREMLRAVKPNLA